MPREKKWASEAERLAAYRARKAQELVDPDLPVHDVSVPEPALPVGEMVLFEGKLYPRKHSPSWSLEQYLRHELAVTKDQIKRGGIRDIEVRGESTMDRSERYLRWRYAGFCAGEVASL